MDRRPPDPAPAPVAFLEELRKIRKNLDTITWAAHLAGAMMLLGLLGPMRCQRDSTDPPGKGWSARASGLRVYVDNATGCQYVAAAPFATLTPRLNADGRQRCGGEP